MWYAIVGVAFWLFGYLVGSNNPLPSVKQKIIDSVTNKKS